MAERSLLGRKGLNFGSGICLINRPEIQEGSPTNYGAGNLQRGDDHCGERCSSYNYIQWSTAGKVSPDKLARICRAPVPLIIITIWSLARITSCNLSLLFFLGELRVPKLRQRTYGRPDNRDGK